MKKKKTMKKKFCRRIEKTVFRKRISRLWHSGNAGTIHGLHFSGAPRIVRVKRLRDGASVNERITNSKDWQAREKEGGKKRACCGRSPVKVGSKRA